ncbi:hypothetical protein [Ferrimonas senticii]|uniref:hypothetical protein n=1 Tax=Ferrimonas senticii TaxID=394566 RepID=UPI000406B761|nr:hypothetical protein [Ferrimonas senticii]
MCAVNSKWRSGLIAAVALLTMGNAAATNMQQQIDTQMKLSSQQTSLAVQAAALQQARQQAHQALLGYQSAPSLVAEEVTEQHQQIAQQARQDAQQLAADCWQGPDQPVAVARQ